MLNKYTNSLKIRLGTISLLAPGQRWSSRGTSRPKSRNKAYLKGVFDIMGQRNGAVADKETFAELSPLNMDIIPIMERELQLAYSGRYLIISYPIDIPRRGEFRL
ncbi:hypothetical protein CEXT_559961 [Caerostris extrusa]|uniref:Uncharacterized protein n=1 Tax=Caerostris extrusa TaxID=172846 RepID=A0AAV4VNX4_CAEEX|nr:hypothetical protein CEXT_559961 [Caerostris extrusa]